MSAAGDLPVMYRRRLSTSEDNLIPILRRKASWIWTTEATARAAPKAPVNAQSAFRKTFFFPPQSKPSNMTVLIAADDYFAMYVNGVLVQATDPNHDYRTVTAFSIPIPVILGEPTSSAVLGFRVVNQLDNAGLLVAAQVNYEEGRNPDVFYTGLDQTWAGERLFQEHWEQPWFDPNAQRPSWRPAQVYTSAQLSPAILSLGADQEIAVMGALPATHGGTSQQMPSPTSDLCSEQGCSQGLRLSKGALAGSFVGSALLAVLVGTVVSVLLAKRRYRASGCGPSTPSPTVWEVSPRARQSTSNVSSAPRPGRALSTVSIG